MVVALFLLLLAEKGEGDGAGGGGGGGQKENKRQNVSNLGLTVTDKNLGHYSSQACANRKIPGLLLTLGESGWKYAPRMNPSVPVTVIINDPDPSHLNLGHPYTVQVSCS